VAEISAVLTASQRISRPCAPDVPRLPTPSYSVHSAPLARMAGISLKESGARRQCVKSLPRTTVVKFLQAQFLVELPVQVSVVTKANCDRSSLASIWMQVEVKKESNMIVSAC
jgi:hypothetical protein